jgi:hypothetical protein
LAAICWKEGIEIKHNTPSIITKWNPLDDSGKIYLSISAAPFTLRDTLDNISAKAAKKTVMD